MKTETIVIGIVLRRRVIKMQLELDLGHISPTIEVFGFNPARTKILHDEGIYTIGELMECGDGDSHNLDIPFLLKKKWFGRKTLMKITEKLDELGIDW